MMMHYEIRQAWRSQWAALMVIAILVLASIAAAVGILTPYNRPEFAIIARILIVLCVIGLITVIYRHYQWKFSIDEMSIESTHGIVGRDISSTRIRDLRNINLRKSLRQRLLNIGDLEFSSAGGSGIEARFHGIADPRGTKCHVQRLLNLVGRPPAGP